MIASREAERSRWHRMAMMSPIDMAMYLFELRSNNLHIGSLLIFDPPPDHMPDFISAAYDNALQLSRADARLMFRPASNPRAAGLPAWQSVTRVDMARHLTRLALPPPGGSSQLFDMVAHLHESALDHTRPMWHGYVIEGVEGGKFALYTKIHHSMVDGLAGIRLIEDTLTEDSARRDMQLALGYTETDAVAQSNSSSELLNPPHTSNVPNPLHLLKVSAADVGLAAKVVGKAAVGEAKQWVKGIFSRTTMLPMEAPQTVFNTRVSPARVFSARTWPKARVRNVASVARCTTNEVLLAMCAGALRSYLGRLDALPDSPLVAFVPVAHRRREEAESGNSIGVALCNLATNRSDPRERLEIVAASIEESKQQVAQLGFGPAILTAIPDLAPNLLHMLPFDPTVPPSFNVVISTVPGPKRPLYWNGAQLTDLYPISLVCDGVGLNITVCYYSDTIQFGFLGAAECVPQLERLVDETETALQDLEAAYLLDPAGGAV